ncbi:MAG TPA: hypothetical protein PLZ86_09895, partial [bacterium]|nr:hypothetical protein [bacterium]
FRKNPAYFGQIARNATMKLVLAHVGSYSVPSPDAPDFLEAVSRGATDLNFIDALPELTKNNIGLMAVLNAIKAEGKRRGLDKEIWPDRPSGHPHAEYSAKSGPSLNITAAGGEKVAFRQQLYDTAHGPAVVVGYGTIVRSGTAHKKGLRPIAPKEIDEEVLFSRGDAFKKALAVAGKELASLLAARKGDAAIPAQSRKRMLAKARKTIENGHHSGGKLAILPGAKGLSWLFDAGVAEISIDAKTGKAKVMYKGFVD